MKKSIFSYNKKSSCCDKNNYVDKNLSIDLSFKNDSKNFLLKVNVN